MAQSAGMLAGAGTVLNAGQVAAAVAAGARFIVSPGWSETVFDACQRHGVPLIPGTATASEMQRAREHGIDLVKFFFPAEAMGGLATVAALAAPL